LISSNDFSNEVEVAMPVNTSFEDCYARWEGGELIIGTELIERRWIVQEAGLVSVSFLNRKSGTQWCSGPARQASLVPATGRGDGAVPELTLESVRVVQNLAGKPSLIATVMLTRGVQKQELEFQVFPRGRGVTIRMVRAEGVAEQREEGSSDEKTASTGIEASALPGADQIPFRDTLDVLRVNPLHATLTQVILKDQTDHHDNLVFENSWMLHPSEKAIQLSGNLFVLENRITQEGLVFVKHAPLPHARPISNPVDLILHREDLAFLGNGAANDGAGNPSTLLAYSGGKEGRTRALHELQRQIRPYFPGRDGLFLSNTWGDRARDSRLSEDFMKAEIEVAAKLGVEVLQMDDGWQKGRSANSIEKGGVWESYWDFDANFWTPHPVRFPNGLTPVIEHCRAKGVALGIWFGPDSSKDFANWRKDADVIIAMHREHGIAHVKVDAIKARTKLGEQNLRSFFDAVLRETQARVVFDLDVTAEIRPGYFGLMDIGSIFVENRYTDWHNYWPHHTLRNFWQLSQFIDPLRLRMEFLNPARNKQLYANDPLAPIQYPADYLFASVMFASPLGWFEVTGLAPDHIARLARLIAIWKQHRDAIFTSQTLPIGEAPDGTQWTGFVNLNHSGQSGYALIFRELNDQPHHTFALPIPANAKWETRLLAGTGRAEFMGDQLSVQIDLPLRYLWIYFEDRSYSRGDSYQ
jgi:alpha-galactosidase